MISRLILAALLACGIAVSASAQTVPPSAALGTVAGLAAPNRVNLGIDRLLRDWPILRGGHRAIRANVQLGHRSADHLSEFVCLAGAVSPRQANALVC